jgi:hypothetical protein
MRPRLEMLNFRMRALVFYANTCYWQKKGNPADPAHSTDEAFVITVVVVCKAYLPVRSEA